MLLFIELYEYKSTQPYLGSEHCSHSYNSRVKGYIYCIYLNEYLNNSTGIAKLDRKNN